MRKETLKISEHGTIIGESKFKETTIEKFIRTLKKKVNKEHYTLKNNNSINVHYYTSVEKEPNSQDNYVIKTRGEEYNIFNDNRLPSYPFLKEQLDSLCEITKSNKYEETVVNEMEENNLKNHNNVKDLGIYKKFLKVSFKKQFKKLLTSSLLVIAGFSILPASLILVEKTGGAFLPALGIVIGTITSALLLGELFDYNLFSHSIGGFIRLLKSSKYYKRKLKTVENKLRMINSVNLSREESSESQKEIPNIYRNSVINYMNRIMESAKKLNPSVRQEKLLTLRKILNNYSIRINKITNQTSKGLTTETESRITGDTLGELFILEMEIEQLIKDKTRTDIDRSETEEFRERLDSYILESNSELQTSTGQMEMVLRQ